MKSVYSFYADAAIIALQSILAHKLRAFLTLIGIIIGVASVILVAASIDGLNSYVTETVSKVLGANHFMISRIAFVGNVSQEDFEKMDRRNKRLTWEDLDWLINECTTCSEVGAEAQTRRDLKENGQDLFGTQIIGDTANMAEITDKTISEGRFLLPHEVTHSEWVCVIGNDVREKFFPGQNPIDKTVKIDGMPMRIVGVEEKRGTMFGNSLDNMVYIPLTSFERLFGRRWTLQLHGKASNHDDFQSTIEEARMSMRIKHKLKSNEEDDFGLVNVEQVNNQVDQFTGAIATVVVPITFISLVVGGIVVMNIMLVSVTERTFEIGLRKVLGARKRQILLQFLIESSFLTTVGGAIGILAAIGIARLITYGTGITMTVSIFYVVLSVAFSGGIGIIAGLYPAMKAAKLDPIVALTKN